MITAVPPPDSPAWEYLLSHHLPARFNRTIAVRGRTRTLHLCARCTGQLIGVFAWLVTFASLISIRLSIFDVRIQLLFVLLPAPAALDWVTQAAGLRESRNSLRLVSGALLGAAFTDLFASLVLGQWAFALGGVLVLLIYIVALMISLRLSGAWRKVIADHFPGTAFE